MNDKTIGQRLIESAKEALAFARGEPNECTVHEPINTSEKCPVETIYGGGEQTKPFADCEVINDDNGIKL